MAAPRTIGIASVSIGLTASGPVAAQDLATGERLARQYCVRWISLLLPQEGNIILI